MDNELLMIEEMKQKYPDQWLLVIDCELSENTELEAGKIVEHSRCRDDVHKALKNYMGKVAIYYTGAIPDDLAVVFWLDVRLVKGEAREMSYKVTAIIEKDEHGYYAYCPELEGCQTQGDTLEEVLDNIKEAIELYLETLTEDEIRMFLSKEILTTSLEVNVG